MAAFVLCFAAAQASVLLAGPALVRAPAHDSAIIRSDRLGGNFAYSVHEGHAYAAVSPVVQHVPTPVAVSYHAPAPVAYAAPLAYHAPAPIAYHAPAPVVLEAPKVEVKTVETPAEVKTLPLTYALPYHYGYPYAAAPYTIVKAEKSE